MLQSPANDIQRTRSPSQPSNSSNPLHIVEQAARKPVNALETTAGATSSMASRDNSPKNGVNRYQFEESPVVSARNSYIDNPAMDPQVRLEEYEWAELEAQFVKRMEAFKAVEGGIWEEWREWGEVS
jgi:hypothetical protein